MLYWMKKIYHLLIIAIVVFLVGCSSNHQLDSDVNTIICDNTIPNEDSNVTTSNSGIYYSLPNNIAYWDIYLKESIMLCNRAECQHTDETCMSYIPYMADALFTNNNKDKLFIIFRETLESTASTIAMCELNGENRIELTKTKDNQTLLYSFAFDDENLYYVVRNYSISGCTCIIYKLNYIHKKVIPIYETTRDIQLVTAYDSNLILIEKENNLEEIVQSADLDCQYNISSFNVNTENYEILESYYSSANQTKAVFPINNNILILEKVSDGLASVTKLNLKTGEKGIISDSIPFFGRISQESFRMTVDNNMFIHMLQPATNDQNYRSELIGINIDNGEILNCTLPMYNILIKNERSASTIVPESYPAWRGDFHPVMISNVIGDYLVAHTAVTSYIKFNDENKNNINYLVEVIEILPKEDFYHNKMNYTRIR